MKYSKMAAKILYEDIRGYIELTAKLKPESMYGEAINVGENFTVTFEVKNTSKDNAAPRFRYSNIRLYLEEPEDAVYAVLVEEETRYVFNLDDHDGGLLNGGESATIDVEFNAIANMGGFQDLYDKEEIITAYIRADLDIASFFSITKSLTFSAEIEAN